MTEHKLDQYFKCSCGFLTMSYLNALEHIGVNTENQITSLTDGDGK